MRWKTIIATAGVAAAVAGAGAGAASAGTTCFADSQQSTCNELQTCVLIGALNMTEAPSDAVDFYRTCLFTDDASRLVTVPGAGTVARSRGTRPPIYASTFWPLYCQALQRAGSSDPSICGLRVHGTAATRTRRHNRARRHRAPSFTG